MEVLMLDSLRCVTWETWSEWCLDEWLESQGKSNFLCPLFCGSIWMQIANMIKGNILYIKMYYLIFYLLLFIAEPQDDFFCFIPPSLAAKYFKISRLVYWPVVLFVFVCLCKFLFNVIAWTVALNVIKLMNNIILFYLWCNQQKGLNEANNGNFACLNWLWLKDWQTDSWLVDCLTLGHGLTDGLCNWQTDPSDCLINCLNDIHVDWLINFYYFDWFTSWHCTDLLKDKKQHVIK